MVESKARFEDEFTLEQRKKMFLSSKKEGFISIILQNHQKSKKYKNGYIKYRAEENSNILLINKIIHQYLKIGADESIYITTLTQNHVSVKCKIMDIYLKYIELQPEKYQDGFLYLNYIGQELFG